MTRRLLVITVLTTLTLGCRGRARGTGEKGQQPPDALSARNPSQGPTHCPALVRRLAPNQWIVCEQRTIGGRSAAGEIVLKAEPTRDHVPERSLAAAEAWDSLGYLLLADGKYTDAKTAGWQGLQEFREYDSTGFNDDTEMHLLDYDPNDLAGPARAYLTALHERIWMHRMNRRSVLFVHEYRVWDKSRPVTRDNEVLWFHDWGGPLVDLGVLFPPPWHITHPYLTTYYLDTKYESRILPLLLSSPTLDEFLRALERAGFIVNDTAAERPK